VFQVRSRTNYETLRDQNLGVRKDISSTYGLRHMSSNLKRVLEALLADLEVNLSEAVMLGLGLGFESCGLGLGGCGLGLGVVALALALRPLL